MEPASLLQFVAPAVSGVLLFLVKSFVGRIGEDLAELKATIQKFDGRFEAIQKDVRDNTIESAVTRQETSALWRAIDGSFNRASDARGRIS